MLGAMTSMRRFKTGPALLAVLLSPVIAGCGDEAAPRASTPLLQVVMTCKDFDGKATCYPALNRGRYTWECALDFLPSATCEGAFPADKVERAASPYGQFRGFDSWCLRWGPISPRGQTLVAWKDQGCPPSQ
jgi:hypothetical protein